MPDPRKDEKQEGNKNKPPSLLNLLCSLPSATGKDCTISNHNSSQFLSQIQNPQIHSDDDGDKYYLFCYVCYTSGITGTVIHLDKKWPLSEITFSHM